MTAWSLHLWTSADNLGKPAAQLVPSPASLAQFEEAMMFLAGSNLSHLGFVVIGIGALSTDAARRALRVFSERDLSSRVYFAVDAADLERLDFGAVDNSRAGLLIEGVESSTPLSVLANESVEVVRFDDRYVTQAMDHLRSACVLDAMLGLVRDLGLCSLGLDLRYQGGSLRRHPSFDYVSTSSSPPVRKVSEPLPLFEDTSGHAQLI